MSSRSVRPGRKDLILPGQTAAWFETTIYARVNGYVAKWLVDIGDHVKKGQVLAIIETPELDAELNAAKAQLKSSEAQVAAREAEAQFSKSTNDRWRDSPKGVVSDQEREAKKADYESANARLYAANAQVALDNRRSIILTWRSSSRSSRPLTAPSPNAKSISAISSPRAAQRTPHRCIAWRKPTLRVFVDAPKRGGRIEGRCPAEIARPGRGRRFSTIARRRSRSMPRRDHAGRGRHAQCQHALLPGTVCQRPFRLGFERFGRSASRSSGVHPQGTQVARATGREGQFSVCHHRARQRQPG